MDWISELLTDQADSDKPTDKETDKPTDMTSKVETHTRHSQTTGVHRKNKACQVYTSKKRSDLAASEQLMILQGYGVLLLDGVNTKKYVSKI